MCQQVQVLLLLRVFLSMLYPLEAIDRHLGATVRYCWLLSEYCQLLVPKRTCKHAILLIHLWMK
jgi:hypothetical protein